MSAFDIIFLAQSSSGFALQRGKSGQRSKWCSAKAEDHLPQASEPVRATVTIRVASGATAKRLG